MLDLKRFFIIGSLFVLLSGCSAYMAANQPGEKNFQLLKPGTARGLVIGEFGSPIHSEIAPDGTKRDIFKFKQGYHDGVKAGRAIGHGVATVATLGLWEVIGTPTEGYFSGTDVSVQVSYDTGDRVAEVVPLKGVEEVERNLNPEQQKPPVAPSIPTEDT